MFRATYTIFMIYPDGTQCPETTTVLGEDEKSAKVAEMVGLVRAMSVAGWSACVSGSALVRHHETGREWAVSVKGL